MEEIIEDYYNDEEMGILSLLEQNYELEEFLLEQPDITL